MSHRGVARLNLASFTMLRNNASLRIRVEGSCRHNSYAPGDWPGDPEQGLPSTSAGSSAGGGESNCSNGPRYRGLAARYISAWVGSCPFPGRDGTRQRADHRMPHFGIQSIYGPQFGRHSLSHSSKNHGSRSDIPSKVFIYVCDYTEVIEALHPSSPNVV
jgi:hypothetical protein